MTFSIPCSSFFILPSVFSVSLCLCGEILPTFRAGVQYPLSPYNRLRRAATRRPTSHLLPETEVSLPTLLVFADDWGRHPSSCQHLVRQLLDRYQVLWVNTIGTRPPRLDLATLRRGLEKLRQWRRRSVPATAPQAVPNLRVLNPRMWPWFRSPLDRRINRALLTRQLAPVLRRLDPPAIALTTLPIVSDLMATLPVRRWVYYCVDDFAEWPGLDSRPLRRMERDLVRRADRVLAVSETLRRKLAGMGREAALLTHGVDVDFWRSPAPEVPPALAGLERPLIVFWGVIDRRMDLDFLRRLVHDLERGTVVLAGPEADPDPALASVPRTVRLGPLPFESLPALAREAAVLVMPYADLPVTRAMQPLKFKEYLATGRPVVAATCRRRKAGTIVPIWWKLRRHSPRRCAAGSSAVCRSHNAWRGPGWPTKAGRRRPARWRQWALDARPKQRYTRPTPRPAARPVALEVRVVRGSGGGPDKTILNTPRFLTPLGYDTLCAYMHPPDDPGFAQLEAKARRVARPLLSVPDRGFWDLGVIPKMLNICRRERVAIWHGHDYKSNALGLLLRRFWPMKLVTTVHGWVHYTGRTPVYYWLDRLCLRHYEVVFCVSQDLYDECLANGVPADRCLLIENAIDTVEFARHGEAHGGPHAPGVAIGAVHHRRRWPAVPGEGLRPADRGHGPAHPRRGGRGTRHRRGGGREATPGSPRGPPRPE